MLTDVQRYALEMFAESGMSPTAAARRSYMSRHNIIYHLKKVKAETGLDPYNALHLAELLGMVKVRHGEWVDLYGEKHANHLYQCSLCGGEALYWVDADVLGSPKLVQMLTGYCPNCGTKMN